MSTLLCGVQVNYVEGMSQSHAAVQEVDSPGAAGFWVVCTGQEWLDLKESAVAGWVENMQDTGPRLEPYKPEGFDHDSISSFILKVKQRQDVEICF